MKPWRVQAITRSLPPQSGQVSMSMANTRFNRCIQLIGVVGLSLSTLPWERCGTMRAIQFVPPARQFGPILRTPADQVDSCIVTRYILAVIKSFRHKGVERFFLKGMKAGIQAAQAAKLARQLQRLDVARRPQDMNVPGWRLHPLKGDQKGHWSVWVSGNWRLTFTFEGEDAILVDYRDYH